MLSVLNYLSDRRHTKSSNTSPSGNQVSDIPPPLLQMEQVFHPIRRAMGDGRPHIREPRQDQQHDCEPPAARHRWVQVLRQEVDLLRAWLLVPVHSGNQESDQK